MVTTIDALEAGEDRTATRIPRRTVVGALVLGGLLLALAARLDAQVAVTVVMKSGERHTGENPHLSEGGDFGLRRKSNSELRTKANLIAYVEFAPLRHPAPALEASQQAIMLRTGQVIKGKVIEMAHLMHDDESSEYVVRFRDENGTPGRYLAADICRVYL
jgi:hypothetical protein